MWSALAAVVTSAVAIAAYAAAVHGAHARGVPALVLAAGGFALYGAIVAAFVAAYFAISWIFRSRRPPDARIGVRGTVRLVWREYLAMLGAAPRMILYRLLVPRPRPAPAALPVLLVHGVLCNAGVWARMRRHLLDAGIGPVYALSYGPPLASIDAFAGQLHEAIERIRAQTGAPQLFVVAHSMGGLVALAYLARHGAARVRRLVTIGTPYHGSVLARGFAGASLAQLRPGNPWLAALDPRAPPGGPPVVSIWSWHDSMVAPQTSSELPGAIDVALAGIGHNALLADPQVLARVAHEYRVAAEALDTGAGTARRARGEAATQASVASQGR